jgi:hypothetical protein
MSSRVAQANAAVEDELGTYSDEVDEEDVNDEINGEELDTTGRLGQPLSYNRSLMELYRDFRCPLL